jgi:hypothetical protein
MALRRVWAGAAKRGSGRGGWERGGDNAARKGVQAADGGFVYLALRRSR